MEIQVNCNGKSELLISVLQPREHITKVANITAGMSTTLWFDASHEKCEMRASLIACGQFTMCYALLCFSHRFAEESKLWKQFQDELLEHWLKFQHDPYWLFNELGHNAAKEGKPIKHFRTVTT